MWHWPQGRGGKKIVGRKVGGRDEETIWQREEQHSEWQWMFSYQLWPFSSCLHVWINITATLAAGESCVRTSIPEQSWKTMILESYREKSQENTLGPGCAIQHSLRFIYLLSINGNSSPGKVLGSDYSSCLKRDVNYPFTPYSWDHDSIASFFLKGEAS